MLMPMSNNVAKTRMTMTRVTKGVAHVGTVTAEDGGQPDVPDRVTVTAPPVPTADKNNPCPNTCGDGSTVGYTTNDAAGLQATDTYAVTDTGPCRFKSVNGAGTAVPVNGPYDLPATNHTTLASPTLADDWNVSTKLMVVGTLHVMY